MQYFCFRIYRMNCCRAKKFFELSNFDKNIRSIYHNNTRDRYEQTN